MREPVTDLEAQFYLRDIYDLMPEIAKLVAKENGHPVPAQELQVRETFLPRLFTRPSAKPANPSPDRRRR